MGREQFPRERLIRLGFVGELDHDAAMQGHHSGLVAGRRNLRIAVALIAAAVLAFAVTGRGAAAAGLAFLGGWVLLFLVVIEAMYIWVSRRLPNEPAPATNRRGS